MKVEEKLGEIVNFSKSMITFMKVMGEKREQKKKLLEENEEKRLQREDEEKVFCHHLELGKALDDLDMLRKLAEEEEKKYICLDIFT